VQIQIEVLPNSKVMFLTTMLYSQRNRWYLWIFFRLLNFNKSMSKKTVDSFDLQCRPEENVRSSWGRGKRGMKTHLGWESGNLGSRFHCCVDFSSPTLASFPSSVGWGVVLAIFKNPSGAPYKASQKSQVLSAKCKLHLVAMGHNPSPLFPIAT
jgi:hypothetical protein